MKLANRILLCLLSGWVLSPSSRAATVEPQEHPYQNIPAANVFRLRFPLPEQPPPPKITLQGITTVLGPYVLFKVRMPGKPPEPAKEIACMLREGEREGEIEVVEINEKTGTAKFRNHGIEQVLVLRP